MREVYGKLLSITQNEIRSRVPSINIFGKLINCQKNTILNEYTQITEGCKHLKYVHIKSSTLPFS